MIHVIMIALLLTACASSDSPTSSVFDQAREYRESNQLESAAYNPTLLRSDLSMIDHELESLNYQLKTADERLRSYNSISFDGKKDFIRQVRLEKLNYAKRIQLLNTQRSEISKRLAKSKPGTLHSKP